MPNQQVALTASQLAHVKNVGEQAVANTRGHAAALMAVHEGTVMPNNQGAFAAQHNITTLALNDTVKKILQNLQFMSEKVGMTGTVTQDQDDVNRAAAALSPSLSNTLNG
jgi:hypothetical protein